MKIEIVELDIKKALKECMEFTGVDKSMDPPKEPTEHEKAILIQAHSSFKNAVKKELIKERYPGELDYIWEEIRQEELN